MKPNKSRACVENNLGLTDVARDAGALEKALKAGDEAGAMLDQLKQSLQAASASIALYAPNELAAAEELPSTPDPARAAELAPMLRILIEELDTDNPDRAETIIDELASVLPSSTLQAVRTALEDFDFRAAEAATRQLAQALNISLED